MTHPEMRLCNPTGAMTHRLESTGTSEWRRGRASQLLRTRPEGGGACGSGVLLANLSPWLASQRPWGSAGSCPAPSLLSALWCRFHMTPKASLLPQQAEFPKRLYKKPAEEKL